MSFDPLLKLNITSFSSIFELFCAFNFSYATIRPIRDGIQKYFKDRLKDKLFKENDLRNLLVFAKELDTNPKSQNSLTFNINNSNAIAVGVVWKLLSTITNSFDSIAPTRDKYPLFTEKTESLFLCFGFLSLVTLFIGGVANDYYTALSLNGITVEDSYLIQKRIKFWYMAIFMITLCTALYSIYISLFRKPKDIEISKTFLIYILFLLVSLVIAYFLDYYTSFNLPQSVITIFSIIILVFPYLIYFIVPIIITNRFVSNLIIEIDENRDDINKVIESLSLTDNSNTMNNDFEIPNFRETIQSNEENK